MLMLMAAAAMAYRAAAVPPGSMIDLLRTTALCAAGLAALSASLYWRVPLRTQLDASALLGLAACAIFFLVLIGHCYGALALTAAGGSTGLGAALLLALALAALATHDGNPMLAYLGDDTGAVAKRRLLPAAVLMPVSAGFLLLYAMHGGGMSPALAVALTVFANVVMMLVLIDHAGDKVSAVTQQKEERWQARAQAAKRQGTRDALTGLLNRQGWDHALENAQHRCKAEKIEACVVMIDLDGLKRINDTQGHAAGDELIADAAKALRTAARRSDALARLGGDEFAYLAVGGDVIRAASLAGRFEQTLALARIAGSIGYAVSARGNLDEAVKAADAAMYERKRARKLKRA
jgi:diguanylate cyclase (GGDEF)-like protein